MKYTAWGQYGELLIAGELEPKFVDGTPISTILKWHIEADNWEEAKQKWEQLRGLSARLLPFHFKIGQKFYMSCRPWVCTDVGTRTIVGIELTSKIEADPSWLDGPPYAVAEHVIDENDLRSCSLEPPTPEELEQRRMDEKALANMSVPTGILDKP